MLTSLGLAYFSSHRATRSVMSQMPAPATEQTEQAPLEAPVQPVAKEADAAKETPPAKDANVAKETPERSGGNRPVQESN